MTERLHGRKLLGSVAFACCFGLQFVSGAGATSVALGPVSAGDAGNCSANPWCHPHHRRSARAAASTVRDCGPGHHVSFLATVLSVRNMSCDGAEQILERGKFMEKTPIGLGAKAKIGGFRCHVYEDDTPPGPSDVDEKIRCVHGRKAFRYRYAV